MAVIINSIINNLRVQSSAVMPDKDPASSFIMLLELFWIPAFAGMTVRTNQSSAVMPDKDSAASFIMLLELFWMQAKAAMTVRTNQHL